MRSSVEAAALPTTTLVLRRLAANTLLPGTIREEELDYEVRVEVTTLNIRNEAIPTPAKLRAWAAMFGYNILLGSMYRSLNLLQLQMWPEAQRTLMESFVLQGLDVIPRTAGIPGNLVFGEDMLVTVMTDKVNPQNFDAPFCAAVLRKWRSNAVRSMLQARGVLQNGIARIEKNNAELQAQQRADIAMHGLRDCALPSCVKTEKTVKEFSLCAGCRSVVYCCLEHQALDWRAHKIACREKETAQLGARRGAT